MADRAGHQLPLFGQRDHPLAGDRPEAPLLQFFGNKINIGGAVFTYGVIFMVLLVIVLGLCVLRQTAWGRHVYAVGDDPEAAELSGVQVKPGADLRSMRWPA